MYNPHADGTDRGNPQDAGEAYVCQRTLVLFFCEKVGEFIDKHIDVWGDFCKTILNKIVVLPIECNNQENAMRIFTTLNDRGLPLSDSDIIKGRIYASIQDKDKKKEFASKWKELESNLINKDTG